MNFIELFYIQKELDSYIMKNKNLNAGELFKERCLALTVELGELANETRCFKFWSTKEPSEREVILEEFVDSVHFLLSLGNTMGYRSDCISFSLKEPETPLTELFLMTYKAISNFSEYPTKNNYDDLWFWYSMISAKLGFTAKDIYDAYIKKNEENYERQNNGY